VWKGNNSDLAILSRERGQRDPYHVFGGLQDNSVWMATRSIRAGSPTADGRIFMERWILGISGSVDANYVYAESQGGEIGRVNRITLEGRLIKPQPNYGEGTTFQLEHSNSYEPQSEGHNLHRRAIPVRSRDHGSRGTAFRPDLTTNNPEKQKQRIGRRYSRQFPMRRCTRRSTPSANHRAMARPSGLEPMTGISSDTRRRQILDQRC